MQMHAAVEEYRRKLEALLAEDFYAEGGDLAAKCASVAPMLPEELAAFLGALVAQGQSLEGDAPDSAALEFVFRCGQAVERLAAFKHRRVDESLVEMGADGLPLEPLAEAELDTMARLLAARDRAVKAVADFTLKALLFCLGLLVLWVLVNLL
ncbi:hypothetical protein [Methylogaea oryzae]|uniref:Uncharacterized protein n=1 Tax=Methylogaea oryzae TaxID=1295382 RepID=A0A8D4VNF4_9GAMM|nr:hypothetical protein [Methylogaea oryzae]BBL70821.1 hypothetical protein MoryE10_14270 [Methylogaea oryzae]